MPSRSRRVLFALASLAAWRVGFYVLTPWVQATLFSPAADPAWATIRGHWFAWQLTGTALAIVVWLAGARLGLMPSFPKTTFGSGGSWSRVAKAGLAATAVLLVLTFAIGLGAGGKLGFHPSGAKMLGDLVSNMYEEIVHRGLILCAFYGAGANETFALDGRLDRKGLALGTVVSCVVFAAGHQQYPLPLRVVLAVIAVVFAWPFLRARSLWAAWIPHTLGDFVGDAFLKL